MRLAGHLGVRAPDRPLFGHLAGSADPVDQIAFLAANGFAGASDNFLSLRAHVEQQRIGAALTAAGLVMGSFVHDPLHWNAPCWSAERDDERALLAEAFGLSLASAAGSGGRTINCITGRDRDRPIERQQGAMADNLRRLAPLAEAAGVVLAIEATHPDYAPGLLVERWSDALALVEAVDHPPVAVNLDLGHIALHGDDPLEAIARCAGRIGMVQIADVPGRVEPGAGRLDWSAIARALETAGYCGLVELELEPAEEGAAGERMMLDRLRATGLLAAAATF